MFHVPEKYRIIAGRGASDASYGNNGMFADIPSPIIDRVLVCIASDGLGWEHVSVHAQRKKQFKLPYWEEMNNIKDLFWDEEDVVMQLHPKKSEYVNYAEVLHLWRPIGIEIPTPPSIMIGLK